MYSLLTGTWKPGSPIDLELFTDQVFWPVRLGNLHGSLPSSESTVVHHYVAASPSPSSSFYPCEFWGLKLGFSPFKGKHSQWSYVLSPEERVCCSQLPGAGQEMEEAGGICGQDPWAVVFAGQAWLVRQG